MYSFESTLVRLKVFVGLYTKFFRILYSNAMILKSFSIVYTMKYIYIFRIDAEFCEIVDLIKMFNKNTTNYISVLENDTESNPHYQGYLETFKQISTIRQYIRRLLTETGNKSYSLKKADPNKMDAYKRYICKGKQDRVPSIDHEVNIHRDFETIETCITPWLESNHTMYWLNFENMKIKQQLKDNKTVIQRMLTCNKFDINFITDDEITIRGKVLRYYHEKCKIYPNPSAFKGIVNWFVTQIHLGENDGSDLYYQKRAFDLFYS